MAADNHTTIVGNLVDDPSCASPTPASPWPTCASRSHSVSSRTASGAPAPSSWSRCSSPPPRRSSPSSSAREGATYTTLTPLPSPPLRTPGYGRGRLGAAARDCSTRPWPHDHPAEGPGAQRLLQAEGARNRQRRAPLGRHHLKVMCSSAAVRPALSGRGRPPNRQRGWSEQQNPSPPVNRRPGPIRTGMRSPKRPPTDVCAGHRLVEPPAGIEPATPSLP
jgi:hypothetical protein